MTIRALILPAALAGLLGLAGCAPPEEAPKPEDRPKAGEKPQAEVRKRKTPAELLVGTWTIAESSVGTAYPECSQKQFTADGRWFDRVDEPFGHP